MIEFLADIEYDQLSLEMIEFDFFLKMIESPALSFVPVSDMQGLPIYELKVNN